MTSEEIEALLIKLGYTKESGIFEYGSRVYSYLDKHSLLKCQFQIYDNDDGYLYFSLLVENSNSAQHCDDEVDYCRLNNFRRIKYEDFTKQKLDEILSQYNKIKTALHVINQIAKI